MSETSEFIETRDVKAPETLDELILELHKVFNYDRVNVDYVMHLLSLYKSRAKDWKKFAKFDDHRYTRNLVDAGNGKFNLMILCWNESQGSSIHSHADAHCFVKVLDGNLEETMYDWPTDSQDESQMSQREKNVYGKNGVTYINDDLGLHRMENPSHSERAITMHLYSPPFDQCDCFDERTGHKTKVKVTFWSKFGSRTPYKPEMSCSVSLSGENHNPAATEIENN